MRNLPGGIAKIWSTGKRPWVRGLFVLLVIVLIIAGLSWTGSSQVPATATLRPGQIQATPTLPAYLGQDISQMTPIILGGALLVLIILAGTIGTTRSHT